MTVACDVVSGVPSNAVGTRRATVRELADGLRLAVMAVAREPVTCVRSAAGGCVADPAGRVRPFGDRRPRRTPRTAWTGRPRRRPERRRP
jgi:hypothetical protein